MRFFDTIVNWMGETFLALGTTKKTICPTTPGQSKSKAFVYISDKI